LAGETFDQESVFKKYLPAFCAGGFFVRYNLSRLVGSGKAHVLVSCCLSSWFAANKYAGWLRI
jgi:hypothetical protein